MLRNLSLQKEFLVILSLVIIGAVGISYSAVYYHYRAKVVERSAELKRSSIAVANIMEQNLHYIEEITQSFAGELADVNTQDYNKVLQILSAARVKDNISLGPLPYTNFDWINPKGQMAVNTSLGVISPPKDMSFRSYLKDARQSPGQLMISTPLVGVPSGKIQIPITIGVQNKKGKFLGTLATGIDVARLNDMMQAALHGSYAQYIILDNNFDEVSKNWIAPPATTFKKALSGIGFVRKLEEQDTQHEIGTLSEDIDVGSLRFSSYMYTADHRYLILVGYDKYYAYTLLVQSVLPTILLIFSVGGITLGFIFFLRAYVIRPVTMLGKAAAMVSQGKYSFELPRSHVKEIALLSKQLIRIRSYMKRYQKAIEALRQERAVVSEQKQQLEYILGVNKKADSNYEKMLRGLRGQTKGDLDLIYASAKLLKKNLEGNSPVPLTEQEMIDTLEAMMQRVRHIRSCTTLVLETEEVNPADIVRDAIAIKHKYILRNNIILETNIPQILPTIALDKVRFAQIISGVLNRSIVCLKEGHHVNMSLQTASMEGKRYLVFSLQDDGFGINEEERQQTNKKGFEYIDGTNISLDAISELVSLHHGSIEVEDQHGKGSKITVRIPYNLADTSDDIIEDAELSEAIEDNNVIALFPEREISQK